MNVVVAGGHAALCLWLWRRQNERRFLFRNEKSDQDFTSSPQGNLHLQTIASLSACLPDLKSTPILPEPLDQTPCSFIDDPLQLAAVAVRLKSSPRLALDIEHHSTHTYYGQSCLIQISDGSEDYIIDAIALRFVIPNTLGPLFTDPSILKVVHGGGSDVLWLLRDFGIRLINIFDTEKCCQVLHYPPQHRSLKFLLNKFVGVQVDKSLQMADWRQRPLPHEFMEYARSDVHWLLYIADCLYKEVGGSKSGNSGENHKNKNSGQIQDTESLLGRAVHRSQSLSLVEYSLPLPRVAASAAAAGIMKSHIAALRSNQNSKYSSKSGDGGGEPPTLEEATSSNKHPSSLAPFSEDQMNHLQNLSVRVHSLCVWRDTEARKLDESVTCVLPDEVLVTLAEGHLVDTLKNVEDLKSVLQEYFSKTNNNKFSSACRFPQVALANAAILIKKLNAAGAGNRPWAHPDVLAAMKPSSGLETAAKRRHEDPEALKERLGERFGVKKQVYENCKMLSKSGEMLCFTDKKRLLWYIRKGLAVEVDPGKEPLTVRLTFDHKDDDQRAGAHEFYSSKRSNTCVACGAGKHYLRYRVVPVCYRRALPGKFKSHRSHDVLLLCLGCHEIAQRASEQMKREISSEYGVPLFPRLAANSNGTANGNISTVAHGDHSSDSGSGDEEKITSSITDLTTTTNGSTRTTSITPLNPESLHPFSVRKAAVALDRVGASNLPAARRQELQLLVSTYARAVEPWLQDVPPDVPFSQDDLWAGLLSGMSKPTRRKAIRRWISQGHEEKLPPALLEELTASGTEGCNSSIDVRDGMGHSWHGQQVVEVILKQGGDDALSALCARFRKAFIEALNPKFLPSGWKVDHTAPRSFGEHSIYNESEVVGNGNGVGNLPESLSSDVVAEEE
jgi:cobalt/nickel-transporting P-type ATPase D